MLLLTESAHLMILVSSYSLAVGLLSAFLHILKIVEHGNLRLLNSSKVGKLSSLYKCRTTNRVKRNAFL